MGGRRKVSHLLGIAVTGCAALLSAGVVTSAWSGPASAQTSRSDQTGHVTASVAGTYVPLTPSRITDTRAGSGYPNAGNTLGTGGSINVQVTGVGAVPTSGVTAVVVNVTVVGPTAPSYVTVFPEGTTQPVVSNLNFTRRSDAGEPGDGSPGQPGRDHRLQLQRKCQRRRRCRGLLHHSQPNERALQPRQPPPGVGHARRRCVDRPRCLEGGHGSRRRRRAGRRVRRGGQRHRGWFDRARIPHCLPGSGLRYSHSPNWRPT